VLPRPHVDTSIDGCQNRVKREGMKILILNASTLKTLSDFTVTDLQEDWGTTKKTLSLTICF